jgi:hypothetical protein
MIKHGAAIDLIHTRGQCGLYLDAQDCRGFQLYLDRPCQNRADRLELLHYALDVEAIFKDAGLGTRMTVENGEVRLVCFEHGPSGPDSKKPDYNGIPFVSLRGKRTAWRNVQREMFVRWITTKLEQPRIWLRHRVNRNTDDCEKVVYNRAFTSKEQAIAAMLDEADIDDPDDQKRASENEIWFMWTYERKNNFEIWVIEEHDQRVVFADKTIATEEEKEEWHLKARAAYPDLFRNCII